MAKATCYIIDDESLAIERLERLIKLNDAVEVTGSSASPAAALDGIARLRPDLVFLDVEMPSVSGLELIEKIRLQGLNPAFIMVTAFDQYAIRALRAGALDYLVKPVDLDDLNNAIARYYKKQDPSAHIPESWQLTDREKEVIHFLLQGLSSKLIAEKLFLSPHTIDTYRRHILEKSGCKTTNELIGSISI